MGSSPLIITNKQNSFIHSVKELLQYWDLIWMLSFRDIRIRYAQTLLGILWALLSPIFAIFILFIVFGKIANVDTGLIPHPLYILSGLIGWNYFTSTVSQSAKAFLLSQSMIKKIYFPRLALIFSKAISNLVELLIMLFLLAICLIYYNVAFTTNMLFIPFFIFLFILASLTFGTWVSALSVRYRDIHHIIPFFLQIGLFVTPIAFTVDHIPEKYMWVYYLNPMAIIIDGFRWSIFGTSLDAIHLCVMSGLLCFILVLGVRYFNHSTRLVSDLI